MNPMRNLIYRYGIALGAVFIAFLASKGLSSLIGALPAPFATFGPAVVLVALLFGQGPGAVTTVVSALVVYLWALPAVGYSWTPSVVIFTLIGVLVSVLAGRYRRYTSDLELVIAQLTAEIAERQKVEAALLQSESALTEAQRVAHIGNWRWGANSGEVWWSDELYRLFGAPG